MLEEKEARRDEEARMAAGGERRVKGSNGRTRGETVLLRRRLPVSAERSQVRRFPGTRGETRNANSLELMERER